MLLKKWNKLNSFVKKNIVHVLFLELLSLTPIFIILGNIVPPFPIKIHFIGMGLIFLCALYLLMKSQYHLVVIILSSSLVLSQFILNFWDIKNIIDFLFGPLVLVIMLGFIVNNNIPKALFIKYQKRFYYLLWVPIVIAVLQYFEILPITIWNANYVNYSYSGGVQTPRPNGFLYHGSELSIIICTVALFQFFNTKKRGLLFFIILVGIAYATYFKAIFACIIVLLLVFIILNLKKTRYLMRFLPDKAILIISIMIGTFGFIGLSYFLHKTYIKTGYLFDPQLMTGRGSIWNIYTDAFKEYSIFNYLFGSGIGSGPELFTTYASAENYYLLSVGKPLDAAYDAHNAILSLFVNSGLLGLMSLSILYKEIFNQVTSWQNGARRNKYLLFLFTIIPLLTIGITIPLFDMAIIWPCIGFLLVKWKNTTPHETA